MMGGFGSLNIDPRTILVHSSFRSSVLPSIPASHVSSDCLSVPPPFFFLSFLPSARPSFNLSLVQAGRTSPHYPRFLHLSILPFQNHILRLHHHHLLLHHHHSLPLSNPPHPSPLRPLSPLPIPLLHSHRFLLPHLHFPLLHLPLLLFLLRRRLFLIFEC